MMRYVFELAQWGPTLAGMPDAEELAMRRMIDEYHRRKGPLPKDPDELQALIRLDWDCIEPVLREFFDLTPEGFVQPELQARIDRRRR
jgi:Protein of unknown function (DUF1376).